MQKVSMPNDAWPQEMVITIEDNATRLFELLWIREAQALRPAGDVPPLLVDGPVSVRPGAESEAWQEAWPALWAAAVAHAAEVVAPGQAERLGGMEGGSPELAAALRELRGPDWRDRFGDEVLGAEFRTWNERRHSALARSMRTPLKQTPERRSMPSLIAAWRAGLTKIVTIPCTGEHTRIIGGSALLMTNATREDRERYTAALGTFL